MAAVEVTLSPDEQTAIDEAHRRLVLCLIASSVRAARDGRSSLITRHEARKFLQSDLCVLFVRLLGLGESMSDDEIARSLSEQGDNP